MGSLSLWKTTGPGAGFGVEVKNVWKTFLPSSLPSFPMRGI